MIEVQWKQQCSFVKHPQKDALGLQEHGAKLLGQDGPVKVVRIRDKHKAGRYNWHEARRGENVHSSRAHGVGKNKKAQFFAL